MKIKDKFTNLPVSRQRKYQLRKKQSGMCIICGKPRATAMHCLEHAIAHRERERKRYNSLTYRLTEAANGKATK